MISSIFAAKISSSEHWVAKKIFSHLSFIKRDLFILLQSINWIVSSDKFKVLKRCLYLLVALPALDVIWHLFHSFLFSNWNSTYWLGFESLSLLCVKVVWSFTFVSSECRSIDLVNWLILSKLLFWVSSAVFSWLLCSFSLFVLLIFSSSLSTVSKFDNASLSKFFYICIITVSDKVINLVNIFRIT